MPYNRVHVRSFLSSSELELFESSLDAGRKGLGEAELRRLLQQARTLRNKSRDLLQRQKLATRARTGSKLGVSGEANKRTAQKAVAFAEALTRFEKEADARSAADASAGRSPASRKSAGSARGQTKIPTKAVLKAPSKKATEKASAKATERADAEEVRARPAAVVLREALGKKRADEAEQASAKLARASKKGPAASENPEPGGTQSMQPSTRARVVASGLADSNLTQVQGHTSTQVRRSQAKRDHRG